MKKSEAKITKKDSSKKEGPVSFVIEKKSLFKRVRGENICIANFYLKIRSQRVVTDEGKTTGRLIDLELYLSDGTTIPFSVTVEDFLGVRLLHKIFEIAGPTAILYGSRKDLQIGTQELSSSPIPVKTVTTSPGFTPEGNFISKGMIITPREIVKDPDVEVDLSGGSFSPNLGFIYPDKKEIVTLAKHIINDFLTLKSPEVMYPLIGHISLAPFTSVWTQISSKKKPGMHLEGSSGVGKTFLAILAMSFFGSFDGGVMSWTSTPNSLEKEGFYFRDSLFAIDDFKASTVDQQTIIRILQGYADSNGRSRLNPSSKIQDPLYIRGLLLSTGEDFPSLMESVAARTIRLQVGHEKNVDAGKRCWDQSALYPMFLPGLIQSVISRKNWKKRLQRHIDRRVEVLSKHALGLSNGLRICSNLALNSLGFEIFLDYLTGLGVIGKDRRNEMAKDYREVLHQLLKKEVAGLLQRSPVETFFGIIGQKLSVCAAGILKLDGGTSQTKGKIIGKARNSEDAVYIFPDLAIEVLASHFSSVREPMPFTKKTLREALTREKLITQAKKGRHTKQIRGLEGKRFQAWQFSATEFKSRCGLEEGKSG